MMTESRESCGQGERLVEEGGGGRGGEGDTKWEKLECGRNQKEKNGKGGDRDCAAGPFSPPLRRKGKRINNEKKGSVRGSARKRFGKMTLKGVPPPKQFALTARASTNNKSKKKKKRLRF